MRVIIAGSRDCNDYEMVKEAISKAKEELGLEITSVLSGKAKGVDSLGEQYAKENKIKIESYPADWKDIKGKPENEIGKNKFGKYWKMAGFHRNQKMADNADALISIDLGTSDTQDMINRAKKADLKVYIYNPYIEEGTGFSFWD